PPAQLRASARNDRPSVCPRCDTNWSGMVNAAPIRTQRTGFQKIAQVLSDALLREVAPPAPGAPEDPRRKLVLFSDSRQDAAKLAVGVAKSHWLDALRQALVDSFSNEVNAVLAFQRLVRNEPLTPADRILAQRYFATNPVESAAIQADHLGIGGPPQRQLATETLSRARAGLVTTLALQSEAERRLLAVGMNPGGVDRSVMWTDPVNHSGDWPALFDWNQAPPVFRQDLSIEQQEHRQRIQLSAREAIAETLFSGGGRDFESLKLGIVTFDRVRHPVADPVVQQTADGCIRMLGRVRRITTHRTTEDDNTLPRYARSFIETVANARGRPPSDLEREVLDVL